MGTARKPKAQANSAAILNGVARAGWHDQGHHAESAAAIAAAAGLDPKVIRAHYMAGHVARALFGSMEFDQAIAKARAVLALPGSTSKAATRRTAIQETACASARKAWSRYAPKKNIVTGEKRGTKGAATKKRNAAATNGAATIAPKFRTVAGSLEWAQKSVAFLMSGLKKNAVPAAIATAAQALAETIAAEIAARK